jgi:hypothetical protein
MKQFLSSHSDKIVTLLVTFLFGIALGVAMTHYFGNLTNTETVKRHLRAAANKNCNDCHLGQSWINILNNPVVRASVTNGTPLTEEILVKAKIKVY